ncbi:MAG: PEP-CTERM sorting domain-containing protein [Luteolibacter sp.]
MKLRKILLILPAAIALATSASAVQINWGSPVDSVIRDSFGIPLNETFAIQLGYFESVLGVQFKPDFSNMGDWSSHWKVFDQAAYNAEDGYFTSSATMDSTGSSDSPFASLGVDFSNEEAYIWIQKPGTSEAGAEWFLGRSTDWVLPEKPADDCCDTRVLEWSVSDLKPAGDTPVYGKQGEMQGAGLYTVTGPYTLQTFVVPEASSSLLLAIGGMAVALRRRRTGI